MKTFHSNSELPDWNHDWIFPLNQCLKPGLYVIIQSHWTVISQAQRGFTAIDNLSVSKSSNKFKANERSFHVIWELFIILNQVVLTWCLCNDALAFDCYWMLYWAGCWSWTEHFSFDAFYFPIFCRGKFKFESSSFQFYMWSNCSEMVRFALLKQLSLSYYEPCFHDLMGLEEKNH